MPADQSASKISAPKTAEAQPAQPRRQLDRGARTDIKDTVYGGNAMGWAIYCQQPAIAEELRRRGAPQDN